MTLPPETRRALSAQTLTSTPSKSSTPINWLPALETYERTLERAQALAGQFNFDAAREGDPWWLTLSGVTGSGKTMIAEQLFAQVARQNPANRAALWQSGTGIHRFKDRRPCSFWFTATEFADRVRSDFRFADELGGEYLVGIDDIGAARDSSSFIAEALYRLCNARIGKWTIFTTNLSLSEIAKAIDERVASRMIRGGSVFHRITAGDYAMRKITK